MMNVICKISPFFNRLLFLSLALFSLNALAVTYPEAPNPFHYITDYTKNTLSQQEWRTLEDALIANRAKTSSQIIVVIIPSTDGEAVSSYAHTLFNKWGIGRTKNNENNGVLLLIAKNDRKLFIATGRGLEGALPDAIAASIIRNEITPFFKQEQYAAGIARGLSAIMAAINGEYAAYENYGESDDRNAFDGFEVFLIIAIIIFLLFRPRGNSTYISPKTIDQFGQVLRESQRRNRGFGSSGGFSGGGNFGGNRGSGDSFGGGSSGGGGAGGSW